MFHIGDVVVYGTEGVCEIREITEVRFGKESNEYYVLSPIGKATDTFYVPTSAEKVLLRMRPVLTKKQAEELLKLIPSTPFEWIENERERIEAYKKILLYGTSEDVMSMARCLYFHQIEQLEKGKKLHASDERFLKDAEKLLFDEISYVLGISQNEVMPLIMKAREEK